MLSLKTSSSNYSVCVGDPEGEIRIGGSSGQDGSTVWVITYIGVDGGLWVVQGDSPSENWLDSVLVVLEEELNRRWVVPHERYGRSDTAELVRGNVKQYVDRFRIELDRWWNVGE